MNNYCILAIGIASRYLPPKKLAHSMRVARYALEDYDFYQYPAIINNEDLFIVALLHDVVEDTACTFEILKAEGFQDAHINWIKEVTKEDNEEYMDYIKRISLGSTVALIVKRADMKDHLMQTSTLTEKLKEKYLPAIPYIL